MSKYPVFVFVVVILAFCHSPNEKERKADLNDVSISYIKLVLEVGQYIPDYIDSYYGPDSLKPSELSSTEREKFPAEDFIVRGDSLLSILNSVDSTKLSELEKLRLSYLKSQITSVRTQVLIHNGKRMTFDEEALALYEVHPPHYSKAHFDSLLGRLNELLPGKGQVANRLEAYKKDFIIPENKLDTVFTRAIKESRSRTVSKIKLPPGENFKVEYVNNKPWSGYNWFKGNSFSVIQVNTDLPIFIDRAVDLACHEGYPGHHVYHLLLEEKLVKDLGWLEYSVYPLFSPQGMISEGSANYGVEVTFPSDERIAFEKTVLFPLAGLDSSRADNYYKILKFTKELSYAGNEAARGFLNGAFSRDSAIHILNNYALMSRERAEQRIRFIEKYRSYVINYNVGEDLIKQYVESKGGTSEDKEKRWAIFKEIISTPRTPAELFKIATR